MIFCPGCGTANREGSRFCNECGMRLVQEASLPCPRCGTLNPPGTAHCQKCGLGLARAGDQEAAQPAQPAPAASQPEEASDAALRDEGLPPWLDAAESAGDEELRREALEDLASLEGEAPVDRLRTGGWSPEAIPIEPIVGVPYRAYERLPLPPTPEQEQAAQLFAAVAAQAVQAEPRQVPEPKPQVGLGAGPRRVLNLALLLALLVPILWPLAPLQVAPPVPAAVVDAVGAIDALPPGVPVLVAFDYGPALAGDLQPVAEAYLQQLIGHGLRVLAVSTQPEGAPLADMAIDRVLAAHPEARYGQSVVNLGYVAGDEAAVRALSMNVPSAAPADYRTGAPSTTARALEGVGGAHELPLIVVVARDLPALRRWIEQTATPYGTPLVAGLPAVAGLAAEPYRASGQLRGVVAGVAGAAAYQGVQSGRSQAPRGLAALRLGAWVLAAAVVAANLWALAGWVRKRGAA